MNRNDDPLYKRAASNLNMSSHALDQELGISAHSDYMVRSHYDDFPMSDEFKELLIKLASPYGKVILQIYKIQVTDEHRKNLQKAGKAHQGGEDLARYHSSSAC